MKGGARNGVMEQKMKRRALFVGVNEYEDPQITKLRYAIADASMMCGFFESLGYETRLLDNPRRTELRDVAEGMAKGLGEGDLFLFYFAGHGFTQGGQHLLFCRDDQKRFLRYGEAGLKYDLLRELTSTGCHRAFVLDACRSDFLTGARGTDASLRDLRPVGEYVRDAAPGSTIAVLRSCGKFQCAQELSGRGHGLFTLALMNVLRNARSASRQVVLTDELHKAVAAEMLTIANTENVGTDQAPEFARSGLADVVLVTGEAKVASQPAASPICVSCPKCGQYNAITDTFKCRVCGTDHLCRSHYDEKSRCCNDCATKMRTEKQNAPTIVSLPSSAMSRLDSEIPQLKPSNVPWKYRKENGEVIIEDKNEYESAIPENWTGDLVIPSTTLDGSPVTSIENSAFRDCSGLKSVTIPSSVTSIGHYAFASCSALKSVSIPSGVTSIGSFAFSGCSGLKSVSIPSSVTSIGSFAFTGCSRMMSFIVDPANKTYCSINGLLCSKGGHILIAGVNGEVTIPSSVTSIVDWAFVGYSGLKSFAVDLANKRYRSINGLLCSKGGHILIAGVNGEVTIPSSVTSIGDRAFWGCSGLVEVTIPPSVTSIGQNAFAGCRGLTSVTIPSSVTSIGGWAFSACYKLKVVSIPSSVTSIGDGAFTMCSNLRRVYVDSGWWNRQRMKWRLRSAGADVSSINFVDR